MSAMAERRAEPDREIQAWRIDRLGSRVLILVPLMLKVATVELDKNLLN
jgi:hypothetical protein